MRDGIVSTEPHIVLIAAPIEASSLERLRSLARHLRIEHEPAGTAIAGTLWEQAEVLYTTTDLPAPAQAPQLRWVQLYSAGADGVVGQPLFQTPVIFTTTSGVHAIQIAEYVFAVLLSWSHRLPLMQAYQSRHYWPSEEERMTQFVPAELWGKTIGIVGYGSIGRQVARVAVSFGMRVLALQRSADHRDHGFPFPHVGDPEGTLPERYYPPDQLTDLLHESDVVVVALPLTPATRGLFDERAIRAMKPSAFLVNIARGGLFDEPALVRALQEGRIAGAALDVFAQEPLPADSPLWDMPNVLISPHVTGHSQNYAARAAEIFAENLRRYLAGEPLYNVVSKEHQY